MKEIIELIIKEIYGNFLMKWTNIKGEEEVKNQPHKSLNKLNEIQD